jgi:hypothetical protein
VPRGVLVLVGYKNCHVQYRSSSECVCANSTTVQMAALTLRSNPSADAHRNDQIDLDTGNDLCSHSTSIKLFNMSSSIEYDSTEGVERRQLFLALFADFFLVRARAV